MVSLVLLLMIALYLLLVWDACREQRSLRERSLVRRALLNGVAFAHRYRMCKRVYREIQMNERDKNVYD